MKALLCSLLVLPVSLCFADVAVYNGAQVVKTTSLDDTSTRVEKFIEVVDLANSKIVVITLEVKKGSKKFFVGATTDVLKTQVQAERGKRTFTLLARSSTTTDTATAVTTVASFLQQGLDGSVVIKGTEKTALPRNIHGSETIVATAEVPPVTGPPTGASSFLIEVKSTMVLQEKASRTSNDASDTLAAAVDRIKSGLIAQGYGDGSVVQP